MVSKSKASKDKDSQILLDAKQAEADLQTQWAKQHDHFDELVDFLDGNHWDEELRKEREDDGLPCLVFDRFSPAIAQVVGDQRKVRHKVEVIPVQPSEDGAKGQITSQDYKLHEVMEGIIRNIEYTSNSESAYDRAFKHAVSYSYGFLHVYTDYSSNDAFEQDVFIKALKNPKACMIDMSEEDDFSGARRAIVYSVMSKQEFGERYPGSAPTLGGGAGSDSLGDLTEDDAVICHYYTREEEPVTLYQLVDGRVVYQDEFDKIIEAEPDAEAMVKDRRDTVRSKVMCYTLTGEMGEVLESKEWVGQTIPIVPVLGREELTSDGDVLYRALCSKAFDAAREYNYHRSIAVEAVVKSPKAPWLVDGLSIEGYEADWEDPSNEVALRWNSLDEDGNALVKPERNFPANNPIAEITQANLALDDIKATTGIFDASLGAQSNETSGVAINMRESQGNRGTYEYTDNLYKAIRAAGKIFIDVLPKIYDSERIMRMRTREGKEDVVTINEVVMDTEGNPVTICDLAMGKYDLIVNAGTGSSTDRRDALEAIMEMTRNAPQISAQVLDIMAKNMDFDGADELARRLRLNLPPHLLTPEEQESLPEPQPTPEQQAQQAKMQIEQMKMQGEAAKREHESQIMIMQQQAEARKIELEMAKIELEKMRVHDAINKTPEMIAGFRSELSELIKTLPKIVDSRVAEVLQIDNLPPQP